MANKRFSLREDEKLINLVAQKPILFDLNSPEYKNPFKRDKVWEKIAQELNKTGKDCKNRWKNIKDTYYRQKKKNKNGTASAAHPRSKFKTYGRLLSFLQTVPQERTSIGNVSEINDEHFQSSSTSLGTALSPESSVGAISPEVIAVLADSEFDEIQPNPIVRRAEPSTESPEAILKPPPQSVEQKGTKRAQPKQDDSRQKLKQSISSSKHIVDEEDEIDLFTKQARTILKKMPPYLQTKAMQEVFDTLTKYKMLAIDYSGTMHSPSVLSASESRDDSAVAMYDACVSNDNSSLTAPTAVSSINVHAPINVKVECKEEPADLSLIGI